MFGIAGGAQALAQTVRFEQPVRLSDFVSGVTIHKKSRFRVTDLRLGKVSIKKWFFDADPDVASGIDYYGGVEEEVELRVRDPKHLDGIRQIMRASGSSLLIVNLEDQKDGPLRKVHRYLERSPLPVPAISYSLAIKVPIFDPCDQVTRIILKGIDSRLRAEVIKAGQTRDQISLDQIFAKLLNDTVEPYIDDLDPLDRRNHCFDQLTLLKWMRNEGVYGFNSGEYEINEALKSVLTSIVSSLTSIQRWKLYHMRIFVTGFTDQERVAGIRLSGKLTGVKALAQASEMRVLMGRCLRDHLVAGGPQFFGFTAVEGQTVRSPLKNNCELGAVRAYAAAAFMLQNLSGKHIEYEYATGGVSGLDAEEKRKRMIELNIAVRAAEDE